MRVGMECEATFNFMNPLDVPLTDCFLTMEVSGSVRPRTMRISRYVQLIMEQYKFKLECRLYLTVIFNFLGRSAPVNHSTTSNVSHPDSPESIAWLPVSPPSNSKTS